MSPLKYLGVLLSFLEFSLVPLNSLDIKPEVMGGSFKLRKAEVIDFEFQSKKKTDPYERFHTQRV